MAFNRSLATVALTALMLAAAIAQTGSGVIDDFETVSQRIALEAGQTAANG